MKKKNQLGIVLSFEEMIGSTLILYETLASISRQSI